MRRSDHEDVPNRIIPPYIPAELRHDRNSRILPPPSIRQPLLGDAPIDPYRQPYPQNMNFNGPIVDSYRRSGFDKGPSGEDFGRPEGRQPLLRTPKLAVEHIGGDMDISRSRSASPEVIRDSRNIRDDRRRDRTRSRRSRSRSRERNRSRSRTRDRMGRERDIAHNQVRDGIVHTKDNYYEFLNYFIDELNERSRNTGEREMNGSRKTKEVITSASESEKDRIILPPDFDNSDRGRMLHCDTTISGLPSSIFFGSGYGPREHYAKYSAAKDLIDKCHRIGVVNSELHAAIGDWQRMDRTFKSEFKPQITKAVNAIILLIKRMSTENLPSGFMTMRQLPTDLIDRFKTMLRMVMMDVYYEPDSTPAPAAFETGYDSHSSRPRDSDMRKNRVGGNSVKEQRVEPNADEILRLKEREIQERMAIELEKQRIEMEQNIRKQVLEEERAKIRAELEMEKKIEMMKIQQQQYQIEKEKKEMEEQQRNAAMLKQVEDEFNSLVGQLELQFTEVRSKGLSHVLDMIYNSATFNTMQLYSTTLSSISYEQKKSFVKDLKGLLESITKEVTRASVQTALSQYVPMMGGYPGAAVPPVMAYQMPHQLPQQSTSQLNVGRPSSSSSSSSAIKSDRIRRLTIGNMHLRALNATEQRRLKKGEKVIAQDAKTGNWSLATVVKINQDNRVTLSVGNTTWKKPIEELYKEDSIAPVY